VVKRLFDEIAPRFKDRPGGYTRTIKIGIRRGDAAPVSILQLTELAADAQAGGDEKGKKDAGRRRRAARGGKAAAETGRAAKNAEKPARKRAAG
jgi:large subunit ribosomal protein L17